MKIKVAILTGKHEYEVIQFHEMLRSLTEFEIYPQNLQDFVMDTPENRNSYSVIVFYNFHQSIPEDSNNYVVQFTQTILPELESSGKGFIFLHHGLTAFPDWQYWATFCGLDPKRHPGPPASKTNQIIQSQIECLTGKLLMKYIFGMMLQRIVMFYWRQTIQTVCVPWLGQNTMASLEFFHFN